MTASNRDVVYTYRYLRAAMVVLLFMMLFSVSYEWFWHWRDTGQSCFLGSISAYYYTPVRTVFVGSLCALGAVLIAYKGHSSAEDVLLNFSGFMAFVVAMVPTVPDSLCGASGFALSSSEIAMAVRNNIWTLIVAAVISGFIPAITASLSQATNAAWWHPGIVLAVLSVFTLIASLIAVRIRVREDIITSAE